MRRVSAVAVAGVLGAGALASAGTAAPASPEASVARYCGKADIGFTNAKVRARGIGCAKARRFVRRNSRRTDLNCTEANDFCRVTRQKGFRCVKSGRTTVKVSCRRGGRVISETHGD